MGLGFSGSPIISLSEGRLHRINPANWSSKTIGGAITGVVTGMTILTVYIMADTCVSAVTLDVINPSALRVSDALRLDDLGNSV
ncbi:MAG: hypothetical protein H0T48_15975 [Gemmatimonadaceae bacterium]|nr:hypothetical protein [Gemmatimonadaceae bacterium]